MSDAEVLDQMSETRFLKPIDIQLNTNATIQLGSKSQRIKPVDS